MTDEVDHSIVLALVQVAFLGKCDNEGLGDGVGRTPLKQRPARGKLSRIKNLSELVTSELRAPHRPDTRMHLKYGLDGWNCGQQEAENALRECGSIKEIRSFVDDVQLTSEIVRP